MLYVTTHAQTLHPQPHSPHNISHQLHNIWRCHSYVRTEKVHCGLETIVRLLHVPPDSSLQEIQHSHLPPKTSTRLRHWVVEEGRFWPTYINNLRPPEVALCCQSHSPHQSWTPIETFTAQQKTFKVMHMVWRCIFNVNHLQVTSFLNASGKTVKFKSYKLNERPGGLTFFWFSCDIDSKDINPHIFQEIWTMVMPLLSPTPVKFHH